LQDHKSKIESDLSKVTLLEEKAQEIISKHAFEMR